MAVDPETGWVSNSATLRVDGEIANRQELEPVVLTLIGLLGIGALIFGIVRGILPNIDLPGIPVPDVDIPLPDWLRYLLSWHWLVDLVRASPLDFPFDLSWPAWAGDVVRRARWIVPILIAIAVAIEEYVRRTRRTPDNGGEWSSDDAASEDLHVADTIADEPAPTAPTEAEPSADGSGNAD